MVRSSEELSKLYDKWQIFSKSFLGIRLMFYAVTSRELSALHFLSDIFKSSTRKIYNKENL